MTSKEKIIGQWEGRIKLLGDTIDIGTGMFNDYTNNPRVSTLIRNLIETDLDHFRTSKSKYKLTLSIIEDDVK